MFKLYRLVSNIRHILFHIRYRLNGHHKYDSKTYVNIPIIINNRNRCDCLKKQIQSLTDRGYKNIIILDNDSTYPPLLEYYKTAPCRIIYLGKNYGYLALTKSKVYNEFKGNYFVYTDPDVIPVKECPDDFLYKFLELLEKRTLVQKVGFSLKIDDLPDSYDKKREVIEWESRFYRNEIDENIYDAQIDTTFALHRPYGKIGSNLYNTHYRLGSPYQAHHTPWYADSNRPTEEDIFYKKTATIGGHWTNSYHK